MKENNQIMEFAPIFMAIFTAIIAIISAYITTKFQLWSEKSKKENEKWVEYKDSRYKAILGLMLWSLDFEKQKPKIQKFNRADINTIDDLLDELNAEWKNMILYATISPPLCGYKKRD